MQKKDDSGRGATSLSVSVSYKDVRKGDDLPSVSAYAFDPFGRLVSMAAPNKDGVAELRLPGNKGVAGFKIAVGPTLDGEAIHATSLSNAGALFEEIDIRNLPKRLEFSVLRARWIDWFLRFCCVKGTVIKPVGFGGFTINLPVCDATVEIYEVDPWFVILPRLPKDILDKIRDIVDGPWPPIKLPDKGDPPPVIIRPGAGPDPVPFERPAVKLTRSVSAIGDGSVRALSLPSEVRLSARAASDRIFVQSLLPYREILWPVLCWYPWWRRFVTTQLVCKAKTDCHGKFSCCFLRARNDTDQPDLWFRVTQHLPIVGETVIYERYPVGCNTHWNYQCGTEVTLRVTDPRAYSCGCGPDVGNDGEWVLLDQIGATICSTIRGMSASLAGSTTSANRGMTGGGNPFAGTIQPTMYFSPGLTAAAVKYKISFKRADQDDTHWQALSRPVSRSYLFTGGGGSPEWGSYPLGPTGGLTDVRPAVPPAGTWEVRFPRADRSAGDWDTFVDLPAGSFGLYNIKIEMFKSNGTPLNVNDAGLPYKFLLGKEGTVIQEDAATLGLVSGNSLIVDLYVDTVACTAHINPPSIGMQSASPECGGLNYEFESQTVTLSYLANQPRGFYTYSFRVVRGQGNVVFDLPDGDPSDAQSYGVPVSSMIGTCTGGAAFAATLDVNSTAIDGYSRVSALDAPLDSFGFMLLQKS